MKNVVLYTIYLYLWSAYTFLMFTGLLKDVTYFSKDFSQVATSQWYFSKRQLPKSAISQAATFQVCLSHSTPPPSCSSRGARPLAHPSRSARHPIATCVASQGIT